MLKIKYLIATIRQLMLRFLQRSIAQQLSKAKSVNKPVVDYNQRGQFRSPLQLKPGDNINNFQVTHRYKLPDFEIDAAIMKCKNNKTEWIHLDCEEQKNTIGFIIKCKQAPNIIKLAVQKMLQCGSNKYPVRNPIQFMTRRSFNPQNYSASTSDYIMYAYQTSLLKDHHNLMEVFLNMMYDPLFRKDDFKEIVWRYLLKDDNKLEIDGDTANELKNMSNYSEIKIFDAIQKELLGRQGLGKPGDICKITYDDLLEWHTKILNPANLLIVSHGDLHPAKLIQKYRQITNNFKWNEKYASKATETKEQKKQYVLQQSKTVQIEHLEANSPLVVSFKLNDISSTDRILLSILSYILFDMPDSVLMEWNTPDTPYPKHYGFQGDVFNLGVTLPKSQKALTDKDFIQAEKNIRSALEKLYKTKIPNRQIQQCLLHLENQYYSKDGIKIITGCLENLIDLGPSSIEECLSVKSIISKTLRNYRRENIFEELLKKYLLDNNKYIRVWGKINPDLVEDSLFEETIRMRLVLQKMKFQQLEQIRQYRPADILQDYKILPKIDINEYEIFEEKSPIIFKINQIPVYHCHKCDGVKLTLKYDVTDVEQEQIKLLPIICESFPWMGGNGIHPEAYQNYIQMYIKNINMKFQTARTQEGMRLYLFLTVEFSDRNFEYGFNLFTNLINDHNHNNLEALSQMIQKKASENFHELSENLIELHGRHIGGTRSPYSLMEDPIFSARATCGLASDIRKISNPRQMLTQLAYEMKKVTQKFTQKNRIQILLECKRTSLQKFKKYLEAMLSSLQSSKTIIEAIRQKEFTPTACVKYFPNYQQQFVFEAFSVPYYQNLQQVPATLVLSAIINQNIRRYNPDGGSFLFKGSLISYMRGSRKKVLELESYYKKIEDIDEAKRSIFQQFRRYTAADIFYTGVTAEDARIFKQTVALVDQPRIEACLEKYVLQTLKQGKSSILSVGPHLGNYDPLIKKGWVIERSIEDMSLNMESQSTATPQIETSKYINIY